MRRFLLPLLAVALLGPAASAQSKVTFRDKSARGGQQTASGALDNESLAGVKIGGRSISSGDILDIVYEVPGTIRLEYPRAIAAEARNPADAIREYETLLKNAAVTGNKSLKRHFEYKVAMFNAARADESAEQYQKAVEGLEKFRKANPDAWQTVPATRALGRLLVGKQPPDLAAATRAFEDLYALGGLPIDVKQELNLAIIDLLLEAGKADDAKKRLATVPDSEPRRALYQIATQGGGKPEDVAKKFDEYINKQADPALKATAYNLKGDYLRRDPKFKKDALYAYLWVDVVYNQDPIESTKAVSRLADLFSELRDEERARRYRDKLRGR